MKIFGYLGLLALMLFVLLPLGLVLFLNPDAYQRYMLRFRNPRWEALNNWFPVEPGKGTVPLRIMGALIVITMMLLAAAVIYALLHPQISGI